MSPLPGMASHVDTLVGAMRERARTHPQRPLYTFLKRARDIERELTFGELDERARAIAASIQAHARPGDCAAVICPNDLSFIEAFMGCQYAGVIPVPSPSLQGYHAIERLQRVLPRTAGARVSQLNRCTLCQRTEQVDHQGVGCPITSADDVTGARAGQLDAVLR